jgi:hypothetical protein
MDANKGRGKREFGVPWGAPTVGRCFGRPSALIASWLLLGKDLKLVGMIDCVMVVDSDCTRQLRMLKIGDLRSLEIDSV